MAYHKVYSAASHLGYIVDFNTSYPSYESTDKLGHGNQWDGSG